MITLKIFIQALSTNIHTIIMRERITIKVSYNKSFIKILTIASIVITALVIPTISIVKEIKAQPIFPGSQQLTKTPASGSQQLSQQKSSASVCNPNDTFVNATESKICGVLATAQPSNTTIGTATV